eukprot:417824-Pyramimonas_sp.AAC.1
MVNYLARKRLLFFLREFEKHMTLSEELELYVLLRESKLNDAAWDALWHWTEGSPDFDLVRGNLRKLERPLPSGKGGHRIHGMSPSSHVVGYQGDFDGCEDQASDRDDCQCFLTEQSMFPLPESYKDGRS